MIARAARSRYRARAWWGDELLAESDAAVRVDLPSDAPTLWFPWADVRPHVAGLTPAGRERWHAAELERFDATGPVPAVPPSHGWPDGPAQPVDGTALVRRCVTSPEGLDLLAGFALIDHDQARVELVDAVPGEDERDATTKRFPCWGDAAELIAVLDRGVVVPDGRRPVVEASQMLGQVVVAAMRAGEGRRVVSAHLLSLRAADANQPLTVELDPLAAGRTFTGFAAKVLQGERVRAAATLLLGVSAPDVVRHSEPLDDVVPPYDAVPYDMGVTGRDLRVVDAAYTDDPEAPIGPPVIDAWLRFREVPDDPAIHAGLLAQFTGHMSIAAALRPHAGIGQREAHRSISTAINGIGITFHAEVRMDRWVLYRHNATVVADGMAHAECRVYDEDGTHLASFTVDAMIRPLELTSPDHRTAL